MDSYGAARANEKQMLRKEMAAIRNALSENYRQYASDEACLHAAAWLQEQQVRSFMTYVPLRTELNARPLTEWAWAAGIRVIVPKCRPSDRAMILYEITEWDQLVPGAYGIMEPNPNLAINRGTAPEVILVPGLAFDKEGGRLGYGGGYYDRYWSLISASSAKPYWLGLGYDAQLLPKVRLEQHDLRLDGVITESGISLVQRNGGE
ncbi:5-formyltetrahydrofolate cyclo-ligase [Paenibacillus sp. GCM10023252]|uniref:5-formyltetrahydrofolate cyclo-ligase n=1 Tax=Paenibacillus sp. GCM10023252 TaxID=3252649 RepID=UPI003605ED7A